MEQTQSFSYHKLLQEIRYKRSFDYLTFKWDVSLERFLTLSRCTEESTSIAFAHTCNITNSQEIHKVYHLQNFPYIAQLTNEKQILSDIGTSFGRIMYLLDSFEDYKWDVRANRFNALQSAFPHLHNSPSQRAHAVKKIFDSTFVELKTSICDLQLPQKVTLIQPSQTLTLNRILPQ